MILSRDLVSGSSCIVSIENQCQTYITSAIEQIHVSVYKIDEVRKIKVWGSAACWGRSEIIQSQKDEVDDHQGSALKIVRLAIHEDVVDKYNAEDAGPQVQVTE